MVEYQELTIAHHQDWWGVRELTRVPDHFTVIPIPKFNTLDKFKAEWQEWIYTNVAGRFAYGTRSTGTHRSVQLSAGAYNPKSVIFIEPIIGFELVEDAVLFSVYMKFS